MWGTLLIIFYLVRDTVYRWVTHIASPLSRLSVVYFLSLCGLIFLSSFVISVKLLRERIRTGGADLVVATEFEQNGDNHVAGRNLIPPKPEQYDLHIFYEAFAGVIINEQIYPLIEYLPASTTLFPKTAGTSVFILPQQAASGLHPANAELEGYPLRGVTIPEEKAGILRRIYQSGAVFIPYGSLQNIWENGFTRRYVMRMKTPTATNIRKQENILQQLIRLDRRNIQVVSSGKLLEELGQMERTQYSFRVWVTVGISGIICLLLTNISSLEFAQNRYVYALIGSFGIHRGMLFFVFLMENAILVAFGFFAALATIQNLRDYITGTLYKSPEISLSMEELGDDIRTFMLAFGICVAVSSIPVGIAACRSIGKVLK